MSERTVTAPMPKRRKTRRGKRGGKKHRRLVPSVDDRSTEEDRSPVVGRIAPEVPRMTTTLRSRLHAMRARKSHG